MTGPIAEEFFLVAIILLELTMKITFELYPLMIAEKYLKHSIARQTLQDNWKAQSVLLLSMRDMGM